MFGSLLVIGSKAALPADYRKDYTAKAGVLREHLIGEHANFDKRLPASSDSRLVDYSEAGTDVRMEILFYKLNNVDVPHGHLQIKCWMRLVWYDTRLAWNTSDPRWEGITQVPMLGASYADPETSEIWLPDLTPYVAS